MTIHRWQEKIYAEYGVHFIHAGDEWYLLAEEEIPEEERYDGYLQLENGVGMLRLLFNEFEEAYRHVGREMKKEKRFCCYREACISLSEADGGEDGGKISECPDLMSMPIRNDFFGETITVSGLVTAQDIMAQLEGKDLGESLLLPCNMLKADEDIFLDDYTVSQVSEALQVPIVIVKSSGQDLIDAILEERKG